MNAANNPTDRGLTQREAATRLGRSVGWVNLALKEGRLAALPSGRIDPASLTQHTAAPQLPQPPHPSPDRPAPAADHKTEAARYALLEAAADWHQRAGTLLAAADVNQASLDAARRTRDALLSIPTMLAPQLLGITDQRQVEHRLKSAITDALKGLTTEFADQAA